AALRRRAPSVRMGAAEVRGRLSPEVVRRIVRGSFGRFRSCYESGLRANPALRGKVVVRFVIGADGAISSVGNGGSDLPDANVMSCVIRSFHGLDFPRPQSGVVVVSFPILLSPGEGSPSAATAPTAPPPSVPAPSVPAPAVPAL